MFRFVRWRHRYLQINVTNILDRVTLCSIENVICILYTRFLTSKEVCPSETLFRASLFLIHENQIPQNELYSSIFRTIHYGQSS